MKQLDQGLTVIHKVRIEPEQFRQLQGLNSTEALNSVALILISTKPLALLQEEDQGKSFHKLQALTLCDSSGISKWLGLRL